MMDKEGFTKYVSQRGKKSHIIAGLVYQVEKFQEFLLSNTNRQLDTAFIQDIDEYSSQLEDQKRGSSPKAVRGLALYYRFTGNGTLAQAASDIGEQGITKKHKASLL